MEGFSNSFAALNFGDGVSDSEISIPSPPPSPANKVKPSKVPVKGQAQPPSVEDVPAKPKAQARPSSRKEDRAYGSMVGPKVWQKKGDDSTPSVGQLVKGSSDNNGRGAQQQQRPRSDYRDNARPHQQKQHWDNGNQQANNGRVYQQQRPRGNNQNAVRDNDRVYKPRGDNQNANGYNNGSGYRQSNGAQEKEKMEKMIVDEEGWTHVRPKRGSDGDLSRSSSRPESRENRLEESANVDSKDSVEVSKDAVTNGSEEVSAPAAAATEEVPAAATEDPKEALPVDPKKKKEEREKKKEERKEEKRKEEEESKQITLKEYENRLMEQRKALEALKAEERRVPVDKDLKKVLVGKKKQEEALKVDFFGRELPVSEEEKPEKEVKVEKPEKKKLEKEEDPEKAELVRKVTLGLCRYARPPVQRQNGRGEFRQQSRQEGRDRGEVQQQGSQGGRGECGRGFGQVESPSVSRQVEAPKTEDFTIFPDLSAAVAAKKAGPQN